MLDLRRRPKVRARRLPKLLGAVIVALGFVMPDAWAAAPGSAPRPVPKPAQQAVTAHVSSPDGASSRAVPAIDGIALRDRFRLTGDSGWLAVDLDTGEILDQHLSDQPFAPASVAKLPTAFYALERLGPDFRFTTQVGLTGEVRNERLEGNLVLIGGGDPELDTDALLPLVTGTRALGFRDVTGAFLVDASAAPNIAAIDPGQPEEAPYNPGLSGLNLNFNRVRLLYGPQQIQTLAWAERLRPPADTVEVVRAATARVFEHRFEQGRELWRMSDRAARRKGERWLPVKAPALYTGAVFRQLAETHGIALDKPQRAAVDGVRIVASHQSRPLSRIVRSMLKHSTNITAEAIGVAASKALDIRNSAEALNLWAARKAGFRPGDPGFQLVNHSGLTTQSRLSPRRMVDLLMTLARQPGGTHPRLPGLAAGYLKPHNVADKKTPIDWKRLNVVSKTGTMNYVRGLAGYVVTPGDRKIAFAIFSNDLARRRLKAATDRNWLAQARGFERALIRAWVGAVDG